MIDLRGYGPRWPAALKPRGNEDAFEKEAFVDWWPRCQAAMPGLHPQAAEQWVHRHWHYSTYCDLPLDRLRSRLESWSGERILAQVFVGDDLNSDHDFRQLGAHHTGQTMLSLGTWDYPLLIMATPAGVINWRGAMPEIRHHLIEGHLRHRFLNALVARGQGQGPHEVLIMDLLPER